MDAEKYRLEDHPCSYAQDSPPPKRGMGNQIINMIAAITATTALTMCYTLWSTGSMTNSAVQEHLRDTTAIIYNDMTNILREELNSPTTQMTYCAMQMAGQALGATQMTRVDVSKQFQNRAMNVYHALVDEVSYDRFGGVNIPWLKNLTDVVQQKFGELRPPPVEAIPGIPLNSLDAKQSTLNQVWSKLKPFIPVFMNGDHDPCNNMLSSLAEDFEESIIRRVGAFLHHTKMRMDDLPEVYQEQLRINLAQSLLMTMTCLGTNRMFKKWVREMKKK